MIASAILHVVVFFIMILFGRSHSVPSWGIPALTAAGVVALAAAVGLESVLFPLTGLLPRILVFPLRSFTVVALAEEGAKFAALILVCRRFYQPVFRQASAGVLCGAAAALGFAAAENIIVILGAAKPMSDAILRAYTAIPLHILTGCVLGLALVRKAKKPNASPTPGFMLALLLHGSYDYILQAPYLPDYLIFFILLPGWGFIVYRVLRRSTPA